MSRSETRAKNALARSAKHGEQKRLIFPHRSGLRAPGEHTLDRLCLNMRERHGTSRDRDSVIVTGIPMTMHARLSELHARHPSRVSSA